MALTLYHLSMYSFETSSMPSVVPIGASFRHRRHENIHWELVQTTEWVHDPIPFCHLANFRRSVCVDCGEMIICCTFCSEGTNFVDCWKEEFGQVMAPLSSSENAGDFKTGGDHVSVASRSAEKSYVVLCDLIADAVRSFRLVEFAGGSDWENANSLAFAVHFT